MKRWVSIAAALCILCYSVLGNVFMFSAVVKAQELQPDIQIITPEIIYADKNCKVKIVVNNVQDLYGFSFDFIYDPKLIQFIGIDGGNIFDSKGQLSEELTNSFNNEYGSTAYSKVLTTDTEGISGGGTLVTLHFKPAAEGRIPFKLSQDAKEQLKLALNTIKIILSDSEGNKITYGALNVEKQVQLDTKSPVALLSGPVHNAVEVDLYPEITITYDEVIQRAKNFDNIILLDVNNKPVAVNAVIYDNVLKLTPREKLEYSMQYEMLIPAEAIQDEVYNAVMDEYSVSFTTTAAPEDIDKNGVIDIWDIAAISQYYGKLSNDEDWKPEYDLCADEILNLFDLVAIVRKF